MFWRELTTDNSSKLSHNFATARNLVAERHYIGCVSLNELSRLCWSRSGRPLVNRELEELNEKTDNLFHDYVVVFRLGISTEKERPA